MEVIRDQRSISYTMGPKNHHVQKSRGGGLPCHMLTISYLKLAYLGFFLKQDNQNPLPAEIGIKVFFWNLGVLKCVLNKKQICGDIFFLLRKIFENNFFQKIFPNT